MSPLTPDSRSSTSTSSPSTHESPRRPSVIRRLLHSIPTLLTFGMLVAIGWFGHHFGWKLPRASELRGEVTSAKNPEWCSEHNVSEANCVECNAKLMPKVEKPRWCKLHGVTECPTCHPKLAQVAGEVVRPERSLLTLANLNSMWLTLHVKQEDAERLLLDQKVRFRPDGGVREVAGRLSFVSPSVDEQTRTIKVRAVLDNPNLSLKANSFGTGWIVLREEPKAITVPLDALQSDGDCQIVFVRDKDFLKKDSFKVFHARQVRVGARSDTHVELLAGVLPGEVIATKWSASLRAELLKPAFGEGCGGGHGHEH